MLPHLSDATRSSRGSGKLRRRSRLQITIYINESLAHKVVRVLCGFVEI